ncbi:hypothetical protein [Paenibacillus harenae]|uniref:hypothetical protein n=1 Tax=Paenibacillus harenae TaxID=306543 RepID=UPI00040599D1|nr:hypothetical protein [Paenibacillus harenae]
MTERYRFDEWLNISANADLCAEEILSSIRSRVRIWADKEIGNLDTPIYYNFIREYPEYIHDGWKSTIEKEIERAVETHESEKRGRVPGIGKAVLIIRSTLGLR